MSKIAVVTDSGCDLPEPIRTRHGIHVVPLIVRFGSEVYTDGDLTADEFWGKVQHGPPFPETSQPSAGVFEDAFRPLVEQGYDVLCLTITSKHSGTFNSAYAASLSFPGRVTVFDTLSLSLGQGYLAILASDAAAQGRSMDETVKILEGVRARTHVFIALDSIEFLRRGGRASQIMPILERVVRVLQIKPTIHLVDGQLAFLGVDRSRERSLVRVREEILRYTPAQAVCVMHTRCPDVAATFGRLLADKLGISPDDILFAEAGPTLSSHAGPGVIAATVVKRDS